MVVVGHCHDYVGVMGNYHCGGMVVYHLHDCVGDCRAQPLLYGGGGALTWLCRGYWAMPWLCKGDVSQQLLFGCGGH